MHGAQGAAKDACHDLSEVEFVGEVVKVVAVDERNRILHSYHNEYLIIYHRYTLGYCLTIVQVLELEILR